MAIFLSELRKLLFNTRIVVIFMTSLIINVLFLNISEYGGYSPSSYNSLWDTLDALTATERADFLEERLVEYDDPRWFTGGTDVEFANSFASEQELLKYVYNEIIQVDNYSDYLKSIEQASENMKSLSFFADESSFDYKNIVKTEKDFSRFSASNVRHGKSKGILLATRFGITDVLLLFLVILFGVRTILSEREGDFLTLLHSMPNGKGQLAVGKLFSFISSALIAAILLYGSNIMVGGILYGFGDIDRDFCSVYGYFSCGLQISVGEFIVLFMHIKLLLSIALAVVVYVIMSMPIGSAFGFVIIGAFVATEAVLYFFVPTTSFFSATRQINIVAVADTAELIGKYLNVNFFGIPVNAVTITLIALFFCIVFCAIGGIWTLSQSSEMKKTIGKGLLSGRHTTLFYHEMYKCFISGKGILILAISAMALFLLHSPIKLQYNDISEYYYYSYISELSGEYTKEKSAYINDELQNALKDYSDEGRYKIEALEKLSAHALYLEKVNGYFISDKGYEILTGNNSVSDYDRIMVAIKTLIFLLIVSFSYSSEQRFGGEMLLNSSANGKSYTFIIKLLCAAITSFAILAIFDGSRIYNILSVYGTENILAPTCSIERLSDFKISILGYLILTEIGRFFGMVLISAVVFLMSYKIKSYSSTVLLSAIIFTVPPLLSIIGFEFMDYFLVTPLLIGNLIG